MKLMIVGILSVLVTKTVMEKKVNKEHQMSEKHLTIVKVFNRWMRNKQEKKEIVKYLEQQGYQSIAIYGMSFLGERLLDELKGSGIIVKYAIDRNAENIRSKVKVKNLADELPEVDAIIVTAVYFFEEIKETISQKVNCPIISLEDIVYEV